MLKKIIYGYKPCFLNTLIKKANGCENVQESLQHMQNCGMMTTIRTIIIDEKTNE